MAFAMLTTFIHDFVFINVFLSEELESSFIYRIWSIVIAQKSMKANQWIKLHFIKSNLAKLKNLFVLNNAIIYENLFSLLK